MAYVCGVCGGTHDEALKDWAFQLPDDVWAIPEPERSTRARFTSDLCSLGPRYFIRCVLPIPLAGQSDRFGFGVWAEIGAATFKRSLELYDKDAGGEPKAAARVANALKPYPQSLGAPAWLRFGPASQRPTLHLLDSDGGVLAREQRSGIDDARYHEIVEILLTPP
jgi:hypothetical protein